jgi:hypothetical protein
MSKKSNQVEEVSVDQEFEAFMTAFEEEGVVTSVPTLPEGWYPGLLTALTCNYGLTEKGETAAKDPTGKTPWFMLQGQIKTDSLYANNILKRDNGSTIRADADSKKNPGCIGFPGNVLLNEKLGIAREGNGQFWNFLGKLFSQIGLAESFVDNDGNTGYKVNIEVLKAIYGHTPALYTELKEKVSNGERLAEDDKKNHERLIPHMLAESQLAKLTEYLASPDGDKTLQKVVVHVGVRERFNDATKKDNYAKNIRFWNEIVDSIQVEDDATTFTITHDKKEAVIDLLV